MSFIQLRVDLQRVAQALERLADAAERWSPPPVYDDTDRAANAEFSEPTETEQYTADIRDEQAQGRGR